MWGEYFIGAIDEVHIFDHARTQAEIAEDMDSPI
jgi:hypothetical protein